MDFPENTQFQTPRVPTASPRAIAPRAPGGEALGSRQGEAAFTLVEITLALAVAAFCLVVIFALIPIGLKSNNAAVAQTAANGIISEVIADLRATRSPTRAESAENGTTISSTQFSIPIPVSPVTSQTARQSSEKIYFSQDGEFSLNTPTADSRYLLTVNFVSNALPSGKDQRMATFVNLQVTWPAAASTANAEGSVETFVAVDRN